MQSPRSRRWIRAKENDACDAPTMRVEIIVSERPPRVCRNTKVGSAHFVDKGRDLKSLSINRQRVSKARISTFLLDLRYAQPPSSDSDRIPKCKLQNSISSSDVPLAHSPSLQRQKIPCMVTHPSDRISNIMVANARLGFAGTTVWSNPSLLCNAEGKILLK